MNAKSYIFFLALILSVISFVESSNGQYRRRACNSFRIPSTATYHVVTGFRSARTVGRSAVTETVAIPTRIDAQRNVIVNTTLRKKSFHFPNNFVTIGNTSVKEIGGILLEDGTLMLTGRLQLAGAKVDPPTRVTVKAMTSSGDVKDLPIDGTVVFQTAKTFSPMLNQDSTIDIVTPAAQKEKLQRLFHQITHIEVELQQ